MRNSLIRAAAIAWGLCYPDRVYNEVAGLTISIWYPEDRRVELEPIGPQAKLQPGESESFTEQWWLLPFAFPASNQPVDLPEVTRLVESLTEPVAGGS